MSDDRVLRYLPKIELAVKSLVGSQRARADEFDDLVQACVLRFIEDAEPRNQATPGALDRPGERKLIDVVEAHEHPDTFAYRVAFNIARDVLKLAKARDEREAGIALPESDSLPREINKIELRDALSHLLEDEAAILNDLFFQNMTEDEVAAAMCKPRRWVRSKKELALAKLKELLTLRDKGDCRPDSAHKKD